MRSCRMLSAFDAEKLEIPLGLYISNDEPLEEVMLFTDSVECAVWLTTHPYSCRNLAHDYKCPR